MQVEKIITVSYTSASQPLQYAKPDRDSQSDLEKSERNDCVVRAVEAAFDISYEEAHKWVAENFERKNKKGTRTYILNEKLPQIKEAFGKSISELGELIPELHSTKILFRRWYRKRGKMAWGKFTTERFIERYPKGVYLISVKGHMFTIKDGVIYGNYSDAEKARTRIEEAYKIE
jgi:hypothetical protein